MFPPMPEWDGLHPLVVHFPIALLLTAPVFMITALAAKRAQRSFAVAALILLILGTASAYVALESGEAAAQFAIRTGGVSKVLEEHEELAETTVTLFTIATLVYAAMTFGPLLLKKPMNRTLWISVQGVFVLAYFACTLVLANTGHYGGRLVHEFGVHSLVARSGHEAPAGESDDE